MRLNYRQIRNRLIILIKETEGNIGVMLRCYKNDQNKEALIKRQQERRCNLIDAFNYLDKHREVSYITLRKKYGWDK